MAGGVFPRIYDAVMAVAERWRLGRWRGEVVGPASGLVVEIGAGTGLDFAHYRRGVTVVATEPDLPMLARTRPRAASASAAILLVAADAEALPFRAGAFDTAVVGFAMCTVPRPARALAELRRVLHPGGSLRVLEHVRHENPVVGRLEDWLTPLWKRLAAGCRLDRRTVGAVADAGFVLAEVERRLGGHVVQILARAPER